MKSSTRKRLQSLNVGEQKLLTKTSSYNLGLVTEKSSGLKELRVVRNENKESETILSDHFYINYRQMPTD